MNEPNADEWKDTATRLRIELEAARKQLIEVAAFLDGLSDRLVCHRCEHITAPECRAMAKKMRGET